MHIKDSFTYIEKPDGEKSMHAEEVPLALLANKIGTPLYVYSSLGLTERFNALKKVLPAALICFSIKSNSNISVIRTLSSLGSGADVVSGGELHRALHAGIEAKKIVFSGVGKTDEEMAAALNANIKQINVESVPELELLNKVALACNSVAPVAIRVNPDVDANTHNKISTGRKEDKFGVPYKEAIYLYSKIKKLEGLESVGIATHIGSQLMTLEPFSEAFRKLSSLANNLKNSGHNIQSIDFGGGLGVNYTGNAALNISDYAKIVKTAADDSGCQIIIEPGRFISAPAGVLITRVLYIKRTEAKIFAIVDSAMNDFIRPSLYDAWHQVDPIYYHQKSSPLQTVDIVGPICESGDFIAKERDLPPLTTGDLLCIRDAGAYGASMSSTYNSRAPAGEVMVSGKEWDIIKIRQTIEELISQENFARWQK
ncbi:MAG: diaminopimelate decarboxylase [Alphaproteobacteria bacterium]|nr:diaminopimelate decarboxylase [Alphaproteobacteria bacterium]